MFHNVEFPSEISYGSKGGPKFSTTIVSLASGKERRNINWQQVRAEYDVSHGIKDLDQMEELRSFFYARNGRAYSFRFYDHSDHDIFDQLIGVGDGSKVAFQFCKTYVSGDFAFTRKITKPIDDTLTGVTVNNVPAAPDAYTIDYDTGIITFVVAPTVAHEVRIVACEFHVHARFDTDHFDPVHEFWLTESWSSIPVVEIKD